MQTRLKTVLLAILVCSCDQTNGVILTKADCDIYPSGIYPKTGSTADDKAEALIIARLTIAPAIEQFNAVWESRCSTKQPIY